MKFMLLICLTLAFTSCSTNEEKLPKSEVLEDSKQSITSSLDSSKQVFQSIISELENNPDENIGEIRMRFQEESEKFELEVNRQLEKINSLGQAGEISNAEAEKWTNDIKNAIPINEYERIKTLLKSE